MIERGDNGLSIGVLGVGRIGSMHAGHFALHRQTGSVVLLGRNRTRLETAMEQVREVVRHGLSIGDGDPGALAKLSVGLLDSPRPYNGLDGLVIAAATESHPQLIKEAAKLTIPLLIEKPLAATVAEQQELIRRLDHSGVDSMMGYHRRFDEGHRKLREKVRSGALGRVRAAVAVNCDFLDADEAFVPNSGGLWRDLAIHDFNALAWVLDERVVSVYAQSAVLENPMYAEYADSDTATAALRFSSGALATVTCGRNIGPGQETRLEVHGTTGSAAAGAEPVSSVASTEPDAASPPRSFPESMTRFRPAYLNEAAEFIELIQGRVRPSSRPQDCLAALRVALAAEESARTGREVHIPPEQQECLDNKTIES